MYIEKKGDRYFIKEKKEILSVHLMEQEALDYLHTLQKEELFEMIKLTSRQLEIHEKRIKKLEDNQHHKH